MNLFIAVAFVAILGALLFAGITMVRQPPPDPNSTPGQENAKPKAPTMMRALALRVALSIALFACIWLAYALGWIEPRGLSS